MGMKSSIGSFGSIFMHSDGFDKLLMGLGFLGAVCEGLCPAITFLYTSKIMNDMGSSLAIAMGNFTHNVDKNAKMLCYVALGRWVACFLVGYCWTRTAQRQASRMRSRYLKAVLRQEVGYFDLNVTNAAEVITSISSDSLVIQDVISEKVPVFLMNLSTFVWGYVVAFIILWRLAIVAFPFVVLLVVPGLMYGSALMGIARKMRVEYNKTGTVAEQAISSIRTVYAFVGESKTIANYSAALQGTVKLGLRQGLAKGLAIGCNSIVFAIWSFTAYYGSRLVMYHRAHGGTVYVVGTTMIVSGLALGSSLSNLKDFSEALAAGERIMEVVQTGSHDELIHDKDGLYVSLFRLQQTENNREEISSNSASTSSNNQKMDLNDNDSQSLSIMVRSSSGNTVAQSQRLDNSSMVNVEQVFPVPSFRRLFAMNLPEWKQVIMGCIGAVLSGAVPPVFSFALGSMISVYFLPDHNVIKYKTRIHSLFFVGLGIFSLLINIIQHYNFAYMGENLTKRIRERMLSKILTFEVGWFDQDENASGAVCSRLGKDANVPPEKKLRENLGMGMDKRSNIGSFGSIFLHSDGFGKLVMGLGFLGAIGDGLCVPMMFLFTSKIGYQRLFHLHTNNLFHNVNMVLNLFRNLYPKYLQILSF
ncbi:hypothetical protein RHMOL_Rhmol08G0072500 [Rhododendron molle]|uniref:Uncharacterized protein n=1 Tax=Rhododendron molle TaxID=49168 RepID=A0ACC0MMM0_RHOML|nr:hypothetical protein RHMOL_Rhmol08G0072500 [Rhododendron molle]